MSLFDKIYFVLNGQKYFYKKYEKQFDNNEIDNDHYDRAEMIKTTALLCGEKISNKEAKQRAKLWYAADHLINADSLNELAKCPFAEVREGVAANKNTSEKTLELLLEDKDVCVKETAILHPNSPLTKVMEYSNDDNEMIRNAVKRRIELENRNSF